MNSLSVSIVPRVGLDLIGLDDGGAPYSRISGRSESSVFVAPIINYMEWRTLDSFHSLSCIVHTQCDLMHVVKSPEDSSFCCKRREVI